MPTDDASASASLDGEATRVQTHKSSKVQTRVHNRDGRARHRIIEALLTSPSEDHGRAAQKIRECCRTPLILAGDGGELAVSLCRCQHRLCPTCSRRRGVQAADRVAGLVRRMNAPRFLTLTLAASDAPLSEQIDRLLACFRQLRRLKAWGDHVRGGVATIECTFNASTGCWHPHIHAIVDGTFLPQPKLKSAWLKVTGDSYIVDVRKVHDARQAARYVASYMTKHGAVAGWPMERIREYATGMFGRRMLQTFGSCHGIETDKKPEPDAPSTLEPVASAQEIEALAEEGYRHARTAVAWAHRLGGIWRLIWPGTPATTQSPLAPEDEAIRDAIRRAAAEVRRLAEAPEPPPPKPPPPPPPHPRLYDEPVTPLAAQRYR